VAGPLRVEQGSVGYVLTFRNIGERVEIEAKLEKDALYDPLTGLPNRALFVDRVTMALNRRSRRNDQSCGVLILDLDRFKEIKGALGHAAGEALLVAVGERLRSALRPHDSASRVGPDEYAVLIENILDPSDIEIVTRRILNEVEQPFEIYGNFIRASASVGVALARQEPISAEMLIRNADFAMYRARQEGGGGFEIFDKSLEQPAKSRRGPELELRQLMEKRQFEIWYQPIYRLENGKLDGFESLLRLRRPDGSVESCGDMLGVAEEVGLSITLGREALHTVCRQLSIWAETAPDNQLTVSVNVTHRQFYHPELADLVDRTLATYGIDPSRLLFEISETTLNENLEQAAAILERLAALKVRLAVDNFGSGLAPLNYLVRLPIDVVKLAPQLTQSAASMTPASRGRSQAVLESLIHLGHAMGVQVVAQGIETTQQLDALCRMGCEYGQGHLLSYALELAQATKLAGLGSWAIAARA
jgi:diguanylate cyclase (GGDEF)-like protein